MDLNLTWEAVAKATGGALKGSPAAAFSSLSIDSRTVGPSQAFWALKGARFDAHDFLDQAGVAAAAGWVVGKNRELPAKRPKNVLEVDDTQAALGALARHHRRRFSIPLAAVTGSNGKTTVKEMLRAVLARRGPVCATAGNFNNEIGLPLSLLELRSEHRFGVFELGASHPGDIAALGALAEPTLGILTNVGPAHIEFLKDLRGVFREKSSLIDSLPPESPVALNVDDEWLVQLLPRLGGRTVGFGRARGAQVRVVDEEKGGVTLSLDGKRIRPKTAVGGAIFRLNAAAAAAAAHALGFSPSEIEEGLGDFKPAPMRFAAVAHPSGARLVVDAYNANPASMRAGIETFLETESARRRFVVLGDMAELGETSKELHAAIGRFIAEKKLAGAFLAGPLMREARGAMPKAGYPVSHSDDPADLAAPLRAVLGPDCAVYFKASRAFKLEELVAKL